MTKHMLYTKELLEEAVANSTSVAGVIRFLGKPVAGGTHDLISKRIRQYEIDTSHFLGKSSNRGVVPKSRKTFEEVLVVVPAGMDKVRAQRLRRALLESGVEHVCALCGIGPEWNGLPLTLEVDHIDGNNLDNRRENLRFLCPNCHSQQTTSNRPHKYRELAATA